MNHTGIERRKHQRFKAAIPINIGLIDLKGGKTTQAQFKGVTMDISMEGFGLQLSYPASVILPFGTKLMGENKEFDLEFNAKLGTKNVRGVGEARWARMHPPSTFKMGVFLKAMRDDEKEKWTNFVTSQSKALIRFFHKSMRYLIESHFSIYYILPVIFVSSSVIIYWFVKIRGYHLIISCGISIIIILLIKSRIFSRK